MGISKKLSYFATGLIVIEITTDMLTNVKSGPQTLAIIKGYNPDHSSSTYLNTLSLVNDFVSMVTKKRI